MQLPGIFRQGRIYPVSTIYYLCCLAMAAPAMVWAQSTAAPVDIDTLIDAMLADNASLKSRLLRVDASRELINSAGALDDPRISYSIAPNSIGDRIPSDFGDALRVRQNLQLSQVLPWPGKRGLRTDKMQAGTEAVREDYAEYRLLLINEARLLWAQLWYLDRALEANLAHQQLTRELAQVAEIRYGNGAGLQQEVLKTDTRAAQLQHQQIVLEHEQHRVLAQINYLRNQPATTPLDMPDELPTVPSLPSREQLTLWVTEDNPALKELQARSREALLNQRLTERDDYPDMQFNVSYNELWNESPLRLQVGVSLNIPLDFGKRTARKNAAQFEYHSIQMENQDKRSELMSALEEALLHFDEATHGIGLIDADLLPSAEQTLNAALANYEGGGGNFPELTDAQEQTLDIQLLRAKSVAELFMATATLDQLTGGRLWLRGGSR